MKAEHAAMPLVLMYHSVDYVEQDPHQVTVRPETFTRQLDWLRSRGLRGVGVRELLRQQRSGRGRGLVGLSFDDGYSDFATRVTPMLRRYGFSATVFVVASHIGGFNSWDDGPRRALMTAEQLREVASLGMEIASHGLMHISLPKVDEEVLKAETAESRAILQEITGKMVTGFAYPYGHLDVRAVDAVMAAGYNYACAIWSSEMSGKYALARSYIGQRDHSVRLWAKVMKHKMTWRAPV